MPAFRFPISTVITVSVAMAIPFAASAAVMKCQRIVSGKPVETTTIERSQSDSIKISFEKIDLFSSGVEKSDGRVLYHSLTHEDGGNGALISVIVVESKIAKNALHGDKIFPPISYFVNWGDGKMRSVYFAYDGVVTTLADWACTRMD